MMASESQKTMAVIIRARISLTFSGLRPRAFRPLVPISPIAIAAPSAGIAYASENASCSIILYSPYSLYSELFY